MAVWAEHKSEHVRRLASEGCRPQLPWGQALASFQAESVAGAANSRAAESGSLAVCSEKRGEQPERYFQDASRACAGNGAPLAGAERDHRRNPQTWLPDIAEKGKSGSAGAVWTGGECQCKDGGIHCDDARSCELAKIWFFPLCSTRKPTFGYGWNMRLTT